MIDKMTKDPAQRPAEKAFLQAHKRRAATEYEKAQEAFLRMHDVACSFGKRAQSPEVSSHQAQCSQPYSRELLSREVDDVSTRSGLAIAGPRIHEFTVGLCGLVPSKRYLGDFTRKAGPSERPQSSIFIRCNTISMAMVKIQQQLRLLCGPKCL